MEEHTQVSSQTLLAEGQRIDVREQSTEKFLLKQNWRNRTNFPPMKSSWIGRSIFEAVVCRKNRQLLFLFGRKI